MAGDPVVVPLGMSKRRNGGGGGGAGRGGGAGGGHQAPGEWSNYLTRTTTGKPESTVHNVLLVLEHDEALAGLFSLDEFKNIVRLTRDAVWAGGERDEFTDQDGTELAGWLGSPLRYQLSAKRELVMDCVEAMARRSKVHPVREYLEGLVWDGKPRIDDMFPRLFSADVSDYTMQAARCFMVSAVARILWTDPMVRHNGAQVDFMLVLEGEQGRGKTGAVRELFGSQWYAEANESPSSKDFYQALRGRWCVEIGEMDSFSKADVTKVKQAITSRFDTYRPSYGRVARSFRRENVFVGTTNETEYLRDPTGGRRFLPVAVGKVDIAAIREERDQLWAEAVVLFRMGFAWWTLPDEAVKHQDERFMEDSWQEPIQRWLDGKASVGTYEPGSAQAVGGAPVQSTTTTELLIRALCIDIGKHGRPEQMRVAAVMKRLGWRHARNTVEGERTRMWVPEAGGSHAPS